MKKKKGKKKTNMYQNKKIIRKIESKFFPNSKNST